MSATDQSTSLDGAPTVQVTMLGARGTGKTTYLLGMYAEMSAGVEKYFMTSDPGTHLRLTTDWDALMEDGLLPKGTDKSQTYQFRFRYGMTTLLELDWLDYRGGAITSVDVDPSATQVHERLAQTDSLYLTFDGALLASVLAGEAKGKNQLKYAVSLYNNLLAFASDRRREAGLVQPSIVLLVTKSDRLIEYLSGDSEERQRKVVDWVSGQFEQIFEPGCDVAVCTVSLGELGREPEKVEPAVVDPARVHKPMVFTLFTWYRRQAILFDASAEAVRARGQRERQELSATQAPGIKRFLGRKRANELTAASERSGEEAALLAQLANECWARVRVLEGELQDVEMFIDGQPVGVA